MKSTEMRNFKSAVKMLKQNGTIIVLSGVNNNVRVELDRGGIPALIGKENNSDRDHLSR
ncbi:MAG: hypothetical protein ABR519_05920 [Bacteroidales bacterium]